MENLDYLISYLLGERGEDISKYEGRDKKRLYRALVNIRQPKEISNEYIEKENEFLQLRNNDIYDAKNINEKISIWHGDITKLKIEAIVNPANSKGTGCYQPNHNCLDNQIQTFAGIRLRLECAKRMEQIGTLETAKCFTTNAYNLPCNKVIHTVGPIVRNQLNNEHKELLKETYINILNEARKNNIKEIAIPAISTGVFGFPKDEAAKIAVKTVIENQDGFEKIIFAVYEEKDKEYYERELEKVKRNNK